MPFRSRGLRLRPVNSLKHVVETNGAVSAAVASTTDVINTVNDPASASPNQCGIGSTVSSIYLRVEVVGKVSAGGVDNIYMGVYHNPGGSFVAPALDLIGASDRRNMFIHQEMIMLTPQATSGAGGGDFRFPRTMFNGVVRIPRGYKRNAVEDKLQVILQHRSGEATQTTEFCIECIYKEFR